MRTRPPRLYLLSTHISALVTSKERHQIMGSKVTLLPPLRDYAGVEMDGAADDPARDAVRLRLAVIVTGWR